MDFKKGDRVQAVDELGRWEEARVLGVSSDKYSVNFVGWGAMFNRQVSASEIRSIHDPFHETGSGRGTKRGLSVTTRDQLDQLKVLKRGDTATYINESGEEKVGEVLVVDRFRKTLEMSTETSTRSIPIHFLKAKEAPATPKRKERKQKSLQSHDIQANQPVAEHKESTLSCVGHDSTSAQQG